MKIALNFQDLEQNRAILNDFLTQKGMAEIYGGNKSVGIEKRKDPFEPSYCESTYVERIMPITYPRR